jgi:hypothetical protein
LRGTVGNKVRESELEKKSGEDENLNDESGMR